MDPSGRWWSDAELNNYIQKWQDYIQDECELIWGTASVAASTQCYALTAVADDILRLDAVYWNDRRLYYRSQEELDNFDRDWRSAAAGTPAVVWQKDFNEFCLYPEPAVAGTMYLEFPRALTFATDTSTMEVPAWTRYSAKNYCLYRAYLRQGPNHDLNKALRRRNEFLKQVEGYRRFKAACLPKKPLMLRPSGEYEADILNMRGLVAPGGGVVVPSIVTRVYHYAETPAGTVDGVNGDFTLTNTPNPAGALMVFVDGLLHTQDTHYTLSGKTISFIAPYQPEAGQTIFATYRYLA